MTRGDIAPPKVLGLDFDELTNTAAHPLCEHCPVFVQGRGKSPEATVFLSYQALVYVQPSPETKVFVCGGRGFTFISS